MFQHYRDDLGGTEIPGITFVSAVNDESVFHANVLASPVFEGNKKHEIIAKHRYPSIAIAYNEALAEARHDLIVFLHQDVFLPELWERRLLQIIRRLDAKNARWGVLGCFGMGLDGRTAGHVYSNGLGRELGGCGDPVAVQSLDEIVLIMHKRTGLHFDGNLPNFHLYGTDIVLEARRNELVCFAVSNFCVHNSVKYSHLPFSFWESARFLQKKWRNYLPVKTCSVTITRSRAEMVLARLKDRCRQSRNAGTGNQARHHSPQQVRPAAIGWTV